MAETIEPVYSDNSYPDKPHKEKLNDIIDEFLYLRDQNDFHYNISRQAIILNARRGLRDLHLNASREIRALRYTIPDSGVVKAPLDMIEPVRVSLLDDKGFMWPVYQNDQIQITQEYDLNENDEIVFDSDGYFVTTDTTAFNAEGDDYDVFKVNHDYFNDIGKGGVKGAKGGVNAETGFFQFYRQLHEFRFFNNLGNSVVIEYISDPFLENNLDNLYIHKYFVDALKAYIYYNIIASKSNIPMNEKERARRRYGTEYKNARKKIGFNNVEKINQILRRSRNMNKW